jgi:predicted dithiol-disulfide oxidoreductase (DUF899 family)
MERDMTAHQIVSPQGWTAARLKLLEEEKAFTRARDELSAARRALPWEKVEKDYVFEGANGSVSLADLFRGKSQLIVYHFMFGPDWEAGCKSCTFWADNFERNVIHLNARETNLVLISRGPIDKLLAYRKRMGWTMEWVSSLNNSFNQDFAVSFPTAASREGNNYNFGTIHFDGDEAPGTSVFATENGAIYHTYSTYARGLDMLNSAYQLLDLVPKGRAEQELEFSMEWLRRRDEYEKA